MEDFKIQKDLNAESSNKLMRLTNKFKNLLQKFSIPMGIVGRDQNVFQFFEKSPKINSQSNSCIDELKKQIDDKFHQVENFYQNLIQIRKELYSFKKGKLSVQNSISKNFSRNPDKSHSLSKKIN